MVLAHCPFVGHQVAPMGVIQSSPIRERWPSDPHQCSPMLTPFPTLYGLYCVDSYSWAPPIGHCNVLGVMQSSPIIASVGLHSHQCSPFSRAFQPYVVCIGRCWLIQRVSRCFYQLQLHQLGSIGLQTFINAHHCGCSSNPLSNPIWLLVLSDLDSYKLEALYSGLVLPPKVFHSAPA